MMTSQLHSFASSMNVFLRTGGFGYLPEYKSLAQCFIASSVGTFVYKEQMSKLTMTSSGSSVMFFNWLDIDFEEVLIPHSVTTDNQSAICFPILW